MTEEAKKCWKTGNDGEEETRDSSEREEIYFDDVELDDSQCAVYPV